MSYPTRSITILCSALMASCASRVAAPAAVETGLTPDAVYAAVRRQEAEVQTLRARFSARVVRTGQARRADGVLLVKKPDRFRLRLLSPFGLTVFDYTSWDSHDRMLLPLEGKQFSDAEIAEHSPFSPADMRAVFLGAADDGGAHCNAQGGGTETVVDCRHPDGAPARLIRIQTASRTVAQEIRLVAGQPQVIMQFGDYRPVESVQLPFKIDLTYPDKGVHLEIAVRSYEMNPSLPDSLFDAPEPSGASS